jgi:hypothetical protein
MIDLAKAHNIEVILCAVLPAADFLGDPIRTPANKIIALNTILTHYANANAVTFVDCHSAMADDQNTATRLFK